MKKKFKFYCIFQKHYIEFLISLLKFQKKNKFIQGVDIEAFICCVC